MKRAVISFVISLLAPCLVWFGGYDFDERGMGAVLSAVFWLYVWWSAYYLPVDYFGTTWYKKP